MVEVTVNIVTAGRKIFFDFKALEEDEMDQVLYMKIQPVSTISSPFEIRPMLTIKADISHLVEHIESRAKQTIGAALRIYDICIESYVIVPMPKGLPCKVSTGRHAYRLEDFHEGFVHFKYKGVWTLA